MQYYVVLILGLHIVNAAPPIRIEIDCGSQEPDTHRRLFKSKSSDLASLDVESLCSIIQSTLPKSVKDGKFLLIGKSADQSGTSNNLVPVTIEPPKNFIPKLKPRFRTPKVKVPRLKVPKLKSLHSYSAPRVGASMYFPSFKPRDRDEESSAEKMEKFKKGVQKMLHVVKVLGQIDQYVSQRTRKIVDMLSKTLSE